MDLTYLKQAYDDLTGTMGYEFYVDLAAATKRANMMDHIASLLKLNERWTVNPDGDHYWLTKRPLTLNEAMSMVKDNIRMQGLRISGHTRSELTRRAKELMAEA